MKKFFAIIFSLFVSSHLWAFYDFKSGELCFDIINDTLPPYSAKVVKSPYVYSKEINIPSSVTYKSNIYQVKAIGYDAFAYNSTATSVIIPESIIEIEQNAFNSCSRVTKIIWKAKECSVIRDTYGPFHSIASQITSFIFGDSVRVIPNELCSGMRNLVSIDIPNSVDIIGTEAFHLCESLDSINMGYGIDTIYGGAFWNCYSLKSITIPYNVSAIGGATTFWNCDSLTSIIWNAKKCTDFEHDTSSPFYRICSNITSFVFGDSVEHIPAHLCFNMNQVIDVNIPHKVKSIGKNALHGTAWYSNHEDGVVYAGNVLYSYKGKMPPNTIINTKEHIISITPFAFYECSNLVSILLSNDIETIGEYAFYKCTSLTSINLPHNLTYIGDLCFYNCLELLSISMPDNVIEVGFGLFAGCKKLTSVRLSKNIKSLPGKSYSDYSYYGFFTDCQSLSKIVLPQNIKTIGEYAFNGCNSLTSICIPMCVESIEKHAFERCLSLNSVICEAIELPQLGTTVFGYKIASNATLYVPQESIEVYKTTSQWEDFKNILSINKMPSSLTQNSLQPFSIQKKCIRNGQVFIIRDNQTYTIMGQEIK